MPSAQTGAVAATASSASSSTENVTTSAISKSSQKALDASAPPVTNSLSISHTTQCKINSPAPQPLQESVSNASPIMSSGTTEDILKVTPLGRADANAPTLGNAAKADAAKALKRPAAGTAGEKRKKALKRL